MTEIFNKVEEKEKRRALRNEMTRAEALVWARLRRKQVMGFRFRRQYSVGAFVLDFYCPALKLAVEIDGDSHLGEEAQAYDRERQACIEALGIRFVRFSNSEVFNGLDGVVDTIRETVTGVRPPVVPLRKGDGVRPPTVPLCKGDGVRPPTVPLRKGDGVRPPTVPLRKGDGVRPPTVPLRKGDEGQGDVMHG